MGKAYFQRYEWRYFIAALLAIIIIVAFIYAEPKRYPNIVLIVVDDLGYGDVRANFSESKIATPHIDQLAHQGMRFTDAHSGTGVCSPSRYGILTGQHFSRQPWNRTKSQLWSSMIDDDRLTLGKFLQGNGYHTGAFGKWHLGQTFYDKNGQPGGPGPNTDWLRPMTGGPNDRGFDVFYGVLFTQAHFLLALVSNRLTTEVPNELVGSFPKSQGLRAGGRYARCHAKSTGLYRLECQGTSPPAVFSLLSQHCHSFTHGSVSRIHWAESSRCLRRLGDAGGCGSGENSSQN